MPEDVVSRVRKLVALAVRTGEEEARTAAVAACRLIDEHKLEIVETLAEIASGEKTVDQAAADRAEAWRSKRAARARPPPPSAPPLTDPSSGSAPKRQAARSPDLVAVVARGVGDAASHLVDGLIRKGLRR